MEDRNNSDDKLTKNKDDDEKLGLKKETVREMNQDSERSNRNNRGGFSSSGIW